MIEDEIRKMLEEPDVSGLDWEIGKTILANWKATLPERIVALLQTRYDTSVSGLTAPKDVEGEAEKEEAVKAERKRIKILALEAIAFEDEYPGEMPDELWTELDGNRGNMTQAMRSTVRLTKNGITDRFLQALSETKEGEE